MISAVVPRMAALFAHEKWTRLVSAAQHWLRFACVIIALRRHAQRPQLPPCNGLSHDEVVAPQQIDVFVTKGREPRHIRVLVCQVDDGTPDRMTELACFNLATPDIATLHPETALDALEATTQEIGTTILRRLLHAQWDEMDAALVARHCAQVAPAVAHQDGQETVTVASRFGLCYTWRGRSALIRAPRGTPCRATLCSRPTGG